MAGEDANRRAEPVGSLNRRRFLRSVGAATATAGAAGCATGVHEADSGGTSADGDGEATLTPEDSGATPTPPVEEIPDGGVGGNFELVGHAPLSDRHQYVGDETFDVPRGSNGNVTIAGDCVYVGSLVGYQPPLIVDVGDPTDPEVVGPVPDAVPGVANGVEGIEANGGVLVIDQRRPLGGLGFDPPDGLPERGLAVYDVSENPREPELVARHDYEGLDVHALSLWRDPVEPERLLAVQTFNDTPDLAVVDLTGCPDEDDCDPAVVAEWDFETQTGVDVDSHEATVAPDGRRIYVAQYEAGVFVLDSSNLVDALRNGRECDPSAPDGIPGDDHCLTALDPTADDRQERQPTADGEFHHTALEVPERPYLLGTGEVYGPSWDDVTETVDPGTCPGAFTRLYSLEQGDESGPADADRLPEVVGRFALPEQRAENCGPDGWEPDAAALPAWFSPHLPLVFPDLAFVTYYGAGFRAIDISDPTAPVEVGYFFNEPVEEVRWASYGMQGERERRDDWTVLRQPAPGPMHMFAYSHPVTYDGYVVYVDVHSGLYVLEYDGPYADQIPDDGPCQSGNVGATEPGYEPCPPHGGTER